VSRLIRILQGAFVATLTTASLGQSLSPTDVGLQRLRGQPLAAWSQADREFGFVSLAAKVSLLALRWRPGVGQERSFRTRSKIESRTIGERQVTGEESAPHFGSTWPSSVID